MVACGGVAEVDEASKGWLCQTGAEPGGSKGGSPPRPAQKIPLVFFIFLGEKVPLVIKYLYLLF